MKVIKLYENRADVTLTTYIWQDSAELLNGKRRPAVIVCPGGAYMSCSDREAEPIALAFASMGYHAFVLRYSTYGEGKNELPDLSKDIPVKEEVQHPTPMREIGKAMLLLREHADTWLIDTDKIALCGFSAGAHNCAMYATYWHTPLIHDFYQMDAEVFRPAAVILGYTLSDYIFMQMQAKTPMDAALCKASNTAFLGKKEPDEDLLLEVSPARQVTHHTPPMFLWATSEDTLVPVQHTIRMAHALADHSIPFEMHIFEEGNHGLSLAAQASAGSGSQVYPRVAKWINMADTWLQKRFALELPEKTFFEKMMEERQI